MNYFKGSFNILSFQKMLLSLQYSIYHARRRYQSEVQTDKTYRAFVLITNPCIKIIYIIFSYMAYEATINVLNICILTKLKSLTLNLQLCNRVYLNFHLRLKSKTYISKSIKHVVVPLDELCLLTVHFGTICIGIFVPRMKFY